MNLKFWGLWWENNSTKQVPYQFMTLDVFQEIPEGIRWKVAEIIQGTAMSIWTFDNTEKWYIQGLKWASITWFWNTEQSIRDHVISVLKTGTKVDPNLEIIWRSDGSRLPVSIEELNDFFDTFAHLNISE